MVFTSVLSLFFNTISCNSLCSVQWDNQIYDMCGKYSSHLESDLCLTRYTKWNLAWNLNWNSILPSYCWEKWRSKNCTNKLSTSPHTSWDTLLWFCPICGFELLEQHAVLCLVRRISVFEIPFSTTVCSFLDNIILHV